MRQFDTKRLQFIDSHCHLHDARIRSALPEIEQRARAVNVQFMVSCATMEENFDSTAGLSEDYPSVLPCFGIHPWFVDSVSETWKDRLERYLLAYPSGIGETGIDFTNKTVDREAQIDVFEHHLMLARELERPVNIHVRKAWEPLIHMLKKMGKLKIPGMIHSYSGSADMVPLLESFGLYISFSGSVTNPGAKKVVAALKKVSKDRFVLETDSPDIYPYLPEPSDDRLNEPKNLPAIARIASRRVDMDYRQFARHAHQNSLNLFSPLLKGKKDWK